MNVSPAPVESTAAPHGTVGIISPVERMRHPFAPSVSTTSPGTSSKPAVSNSFGVNKATRDANTGGNARAGAGLRMTFTPVADAISAARMFTSSGTSFVSRRMSAEAISCENGSTSATSSRAPGNTVTRVSPVPSVRIVAWADGIVLPTTVPVIPSADRKARTFSTSSAPTAVRNDTSAPCRAAATAWLNPLPPSSEWKSVAWTVSPPAWKCGTHMKTEFPVNPMTTIFAIRHNRLTRPK